jgi:Bifunctional PLP-dependent enzyme with beta-cystathionase and maltose regulon repressor activities
MGMKYDFDQVIDRKNTNCSKWEFMRDVEKDAADDVLPFWLADMDFPCAQPVLAALHDRVDRQIFGYSKLATREYYQAVCGWYQRRYGWAIEPADMFYSPGVVPALGFLIDILTEPGDGIIIQRPVYGPFANAVESHGRRVVNNALLNRDGHYVMDFDDLADKARDPDTKLLILCSPHNPVGRVWCETELRELGRICMKNDITIIADEIHCDLVRRGIRHTPLAKAFPEYADRIIIATAPSKTFNLAGMQLANIIIHDENVKKKWTYQIKTRHGVWLPNALSIVAAQAAFSEGREWLEQVIDYLDANIRFIQSFLREHLPKAKFEPPEGTYLVWLDMRAYGYSPAGLYGKMIKEARIFVEDGAWFGAEGDGFLRLNCACPRVILQEGLERMARAINR